MITRKELAKELGISQATISNDAARGMPVDSVERARRWRKKHLQPGKMKGVRRDGSDIDVQSTEVLSAAPVQQQPRQNLAGDGYDPEDITVHSFVGARDRREHYQAELSKLAYERERRKLMESASVIKAFSDAGTTIRSHLQNMVSKLAPVLVRMTDESKIVDALQAEVDNALQSMADNLTKLSNKDDDPRQLDMLGFDNWSEVL